MRGERGEGDERVVEREGVAVRGREGVVVVRDRGLSEVVEG